MEKVILASASPRRSELLSFTGIDFETEVSDVDETIPQNAEPYEIVMSLARQKASVVAKNRPNKTVIGADTVVVVDGKILGKPHSESDAFEMLRTLSGRKHIVYTGVSIIKNGKVEDFYDKTEVEFYSLTDDDILSYIETGEPMDKAGAYGIQGKGCVLVKGIKGDYYNVMGLPIAILYRKLRDFNV